VIGETDLVRAAHTGDPASLGALFERYRPRLLAVALRQLGYGSQAEDAVHDAFLIALRRIETLTDPTAVRAWLEAIVRNVCRGYQRAPRAQSLDSRARGAERAAILEDPGQVLDRLSMRDWVWKALQRLPETLRATILLRHFAYYSSYEEISEELSIPVGTVRSRLAEARRRLTEELTSLSAHPDDDERRAREAWNRFYAGCFDKINAGIRDDMVDHCLPDLEVIAGGKIFRGRWKLEQEVDGDIETGTLSHPMRLYTSGNLTVADLKVTNPPDNPARCPVGFSLVICRRGDRSHRTYLYLGRRVPLPPDWY
jgi:RNA polymerase sigma-70 factor (ECF subfamily)